MLRLPTRSCHRALTAVCACLVLAGAPATALAQSAGDEQYADPLSRQDQQSPGSGSKGNSADEGSGAGQAPSTSQGPPAATPNAQSTPATPVATPADQLPRTGLDVLPAVLAGTVLLATGLLVLALLGPRVRPSRSGPTVLFDGTLPPLR